MLFGGIHSGAKIVRGAVRSIIRGMLQDDDEQVSKPLGPEVVTNGGFDQDASAWVASGATLSTQDGRLVMTANGIVGAKATQSIPTDVGTSYRFSATVNKPDGLLPLIQVSAGGTTALSVLAIGDQLLTFDFVASATSTVITLELVGIPVLGTVAQFDNVSVRSL